jgi:hypothetical protein
MLRFCLVTFAAAAMVFALRTGIGSADERWIIEPGPEAKDAQKLGAAEVERAQKAAKNKRYDEAAAILENVARKWPASVHDCNLALAYLRNDQLTRAKLVWDLGAVRNGARPKWCTGEVSTQLSDALRKNGYVSTAIDVTPHDALVEVGGIAMRGMQSVWLPAGVVTFNATAPGKLPKAVQVTVAAPVSRVSITLEEPKVEAPAPDAGVPVAPPVTPDAAVTTPVEPVAQPDAGVPPSNSLITYDGRPVTWRTTALISTLTFGVIAGVCGYLTYDAKNDANEHYVTDPQFKDLKDRYNALSIATTVVGGMAVVSAAVYVYFAAAGDAPVQKPGKIQVGGGPGDIGISLSGTFGDDR